VKVIEYKAGGFEFEFAPSANVPTKGDLTTFVGDARVDAEIDLKKPAKLSDYIAYARELYPEVFEDELSLKRALNELCGHVKDAVRIAEAKKAEEADEDQNEEQDTIVDDGAIEELLGKPGVLDRYVEAMAEVGAVHEDRPYMRTVTLGALSAQLALSLDRPLGTNVVLTGESGRGKNYVPDAVAKGLPEDFVYPFESASAKSFYYQADADPERFQHTWVYPNEAEATDELIETLRPLLSKGSASHGTVDSSDEGPNAFRALHVQGPITVTIPTVRNKLDGQFQTRLLTVEMENYEGRVAGHTEKFADTLLPDYIAADHGETLKRWKAAFKTLTAVRKVVLPGKAEGFKYDNDSVSHGARLWRNLCSFMLTHAWLEQRNRTVMTLSTGEKAVVVTAVDYRVAYKLFEAVAKRSVVNLSDTHKKICDGVYELQNSKGLGRLQGRGFSIREIAKKANLNHQTVQKHKTFLIASEGLLREGEKGGLMLVEGAEPSWWHESDLLRGLPKPEEVKKWWAALPTPVDTVDSDVEGSEKPIDKANEEATLGIDSTVDASTQSSTPSVDNEKPIDKLDRAEPIQPSMVSTAPESPNGKPCLREGKTELGQYTLFNRNRHDRDRPTDD
jgi:hypothetical protein